MYALYRKGFHSFRRSNSLFLVADPVEAGEGRGMGQLYKLLRNKLASNSGIISLKLSCQIFSTFLKALISIIFDRI